MRLARTVPTALAVAVSLPALGIAQYTPRWHVGDWWIVKTRMPSMSGHGWQWQYERYDVLSVEKVDGRDCFVLLEKYGDTTSVCAGVRTLYYVRTDDFRVARRVEYYRQAGRLIGPVTTDYGQGMLGTLPGALLPLFPLDDAGVPDSTFRYFKPQSADLRQFTGQADSASLRGCLDDPGPSYGHPVPLRGGRVFSVLSEMGAPGEAGRPKVPDTYTLQLWSEDYPWCIYGEWGQYKPRGGGVRSSSVRNWLIACGSSGSGP